MAYVLIGLNKPAPPNGCNVNLAVEPVDNSGGHRHTNARPTDKKGALSSSAVLFESGATDSEPLIYTSSEVSGTEKIKAGFEESGKSSEFKIDIKVPEFDSFPNEGAYHIVARGGTDTHPDGTRGTESTIKKLTEIAQRYFERTKRILSVNDLSLPDGGLFDFKNTWSPPHNTHRTGTDADINRTDGGGVKRDCWQDEDLKRAVAKAAEGRSVPRLICEDAKGKPVPLDDPTGLYKHIDFD